MSNIYIQEPLTEGKVLLKTSAGDFDIELWSKEAPKACRNFIQLCLEGYYDDTIFHRVVKGFIVQGGDPTGTGNGGESIYGKPFKDEFHTRLRFTRRGLVAMANAGPHDNGSQFFFTLGSCPELQNKHTIFGKVAGNTIYNLSRFEEGEIGKDERPEFCHKILSICVLKNPFPDITPRETVKIQNEVPKQSKKKKGTKNFKLLSFGDEAEEDEEEVVVATKKMPNKSNSAHDIAMDPTLSSSIDDSRKKEEELSRIRDKLHKDNLSVKLDSEDDLLNDLKVEDKENEDEKDAPKSQDNRKRAEIRAEIRKLKRELQDKDSDTKNLTDDQPSTKKPKLSLVMEQYMKDKAKYEEAKKQLPTEGNAREAQTLALLQRFTDKVRNALNNKVSNEGGSVDEADPEKEDEDESWITHQLVFDETLPIIAKDANTKDDGWYDITDPRNALNKRRREENSSPVN